MALLAALPLSETDRDARGRLGNARALASQSGRALVR